MTRTGTGRPNMGTRGRETQDMGHRSDSYSPLPKGASRTLHHPTGRGGGSSGGLKGHGDRTGGLQGGARSGTHGGAGSSGGHGGSGNSRGHGRSASETLAPAPALVSTTGALLPPQKKFLGENRGYIGYLGPLGQRGLLGPLGQRRLLGPLGQHRHS